MYWKEQQALDIIKTMHELYRPPRIAVACSFGKDSMVVLHLCLRICPHFPVFFVNTKFKPKETWEYRDKIVKAWELNYKEYMSPVDVSWRLHLTDPDECCRILKVEPTKEAVKNLDCWITGLRHDEGETRRDYDIIEKKESGLIKCNPILNWSEGDIWRYIAVHKIPVHPWYIEGYRSLGCACCTSLPKEGETERMGRWRGTIKQGGECGIHTQRLKSKEQNNLENPTEDEKDG